MNTISSEAARRLFLGAQGLLADPARKATPCEDGDISVVKTGAKFELLSTNRIGQLLMSTLALSGGMMLVRAEHDLFAIGK